MSYDSKNMRLMGGVPGQQLFLYRSADSAAGLAAAGYFSPAVAEYNLSSGDLILAVAGFDAAPVPALYAVAVVDGAASVAGLPAEE